MGEAVRRAAAIGLLCVAVAFALVATARLCAAPLETVRRRGSDWAGLPLEVLLAAVAALALGSCVAWLAAVTFLTVLETLTGASWAALRRISPLVVRRFVLVSVGATVGAATSLTPAAAGPPDADSSPRTGSGAVARLSGLPLPDRVTGGPATQAAGGKGRSADRRYVVRTGESLWSIADALAPATAGPGLVDAAWRALYRTNRDSLGSDPDLILPGTTLRLPPLLRPDTTSTADPTRKDAP